MPGWALCKPLELNASAGGILLPDRFRENRGYARVLAVTADRDKKGKRIPLDFAPGDVIVMPKWDGEQVEVAGEILDLVVVADVVLKVEDPYARSNS